MSNSPMLHPDLREPARLLIATGRIRAYCGQRGKPPI